MTAKPFTHKPEEKMQCMARTAAHIREAMKALEEAQRCAENWAEHGTLGSFKMQLEQFMSCDHDEAGFEPYMVKVSEEVFKDKDNPIKFAIKMARKAGRK